ncbi:MAG: cell division protein FtsB [Gammaproteobacteria bacterium]|nr:cell division protein FtsB [Gammaproteobacteria bacterium]
MRIVSWTLVVMLVMLNATLWFGDKGVADLHQLSRTVDAAKQENQTLKDRNQTLRAEVSDLKTGLNVIEQRARTELGMIKKNETFYQIVTED